MEVTKRKGARTIKDIPDDVLAQLNRGEIATVNLVEWLAIDQLFLLQHVLLGLQRPDYLRDVTAELEGLKKRTVNSVNEGIAAA